jgi:hypothetical protein
MVVTTENDEAEITLSYSATQGVRPTQMRWKEGSEGEWSAWETFAETLTVDVSAGRGDKSFWVQCRNGVHIAAPQPVTVTRTAIPVLWEAEFDTADTDYPGDEGDLEWEDVNNALAEEAPETFASMYYDSSSGLVASRYLRLTAPNSGLPGGKTIAGVEVLFSLKLDDGPTPWDNMIGVFADGVIVAGPQYVQTILDTSPSEAGRQASEAWMADASTDALVDGDTIGIGIQNCGDWADPGTVSVGHGHLRVWYYDE